MSDRREAGLLLLTVLAAAATLVTPYALSAVADAVVAGELNWSRLGALLAVGGSQLGASAAATLLAAGITATMTARLRRGLTRQLCGFGTASPPGIGAARRGFTTDCATAGSRPALFAALVSAVLVSSGSLVLLAILDWRLLGAFVISVLFAVPLAAKARHALDAEDSGEHRPASELSALLRHAVAGLRTIAESGIAEHEARRVLRPLPLMHTAGVERWRAAARATWPARLALPLTCLAVLCAAGFGVTAGRLTIGELLAACCYAALGASFVPRIGLVGELRRARSSAERVAEIRASPAPMAGTAKLPPGKGTIALRGVSVGTVLREVDLTVRSGSAVAVVGRSAVGTEALAGVLAGLRPVETGEVLLDGVRMAELAPAQLRAAIGYAPTRPRLVGTSFADAIAYGSWAGSRAVDRACAAAGVGGLVARLP